MAYIRSDQLKISGSDIQAGIPTVGTYNIGALNPSMSISDALNIVATEGSGTIGTPDDNSYTDGFFDAWTKDTRIPNAFDDINELLVQIAPDKAGVLASQDLDRSAPTIFSGYLSNGLTADDWYVGVSAGDQVTTLVEGPHTSTQVTLSSPDTSTRFRGGRSGSLSDLSGSVSALLIYGTGSDFAVSGSRPLASGSGVTNKIVITDISTYENVWIKVNAEIRDKIINQTGSLRYKMYADNGAGETNEFQLFFVGDANAPVYYFPTQSFIDDPYTSSISPTYKYMSGITYYGRTTSFDVNYKARDLYEPVYSNGDESYIQSSYFTNVTVSTSSLTIPYHWWDLTATESITLSNNVKTNYNNLGTFSVRLRKDGKSDVTSNNVDIGDRPINTYLTRSTDLIEYFDDEVYRWHSYDSGAWDNTKTLEDGQTEVNNGRLIDGRHSNYSGFGSDHYYYRPFYPTNANENGTITITDNGFSISNIVGEWNGAEELQMAFVIASESGSSIYDLGRVVGDNDGNIYGIRNGAVSGDTINWSLPAGKQTTNSDPLILMVRLLNTEATDYVTQVTVTFDAD